VSTFYRKRGGGGGGGGGGREGGRGGGRGGQESSAEREANKIDEKPAIRGRGEGHEGILLLLLPFLPPSLLLLSTTATNSYPSSVLLVLVKAQGKRRAGNATSSFELRDEVLGAARKTHDAIFFLRHKEAARGGREGERGREGGREEV